MPTNQPQAPESASLPDGRQPGRPFVGVLFRCCGLYSRIYRNAPGTAYAGRCPQCLRSVRLPVGPKGTDQRFFETV